MSIERTEPPFVLPDERSMLEAWLDYHRATLALKCDGLDDQQLRTRSAEPSSLSLLGLVQHMSEVERGWFRRTMAGESATPYYYSDQEPDADFDNLLDDTALAFARWHEECEHSRTVARSFELAETGRELRHDQPVSLRWVLLHMIEEYARHNGHADLLRERIDGVTGE